MVFSLCSRYIRQVIGWSSASLVICRASMFSFSSNHRSIGGMEASISMAVMLVVQNAPVIMHRHLFCIELSWLSTLPFFDFQNIASPYVATGRMAPMYRDMHGFDASLLSSF